MRKVQCHECGKTYDYDVDDFCPKCGAFNQPRPGARIGADGAVVRQDGLNESGHAGSFVHRELHEETRERRRSGLDKSVVRIQSPAASRAPQRQAQRRQAKRGPLSVIVWIIFAIVALNILSAALSIIF